MKADRDPKKKIDTCVVFVYNDYVMMSRKLLYGCGVAFFAKQTKVMTVMSLCLLHGFYEIDTQTVQAGEKITSYFATMDPISLILLNTETG